MAKKTIWCAFNHLPGGQVGTIHFDDIVRTKKVGDGTQEILFTAKEQLEGFKKQDNVAINVGGKIMKNEVLVYDGPDISDNPNAALVVTEWALKKGLEPIRATADQQGDNPKNYEYGKRIGKLEDDVSSIGAKVDKLLELATKK